MGVHDLVGLCANLLPMRVAITPDETLAEFLTRVKADTYDAFDHQHLGVGRLASALRLPRDASRPTVVSTVITLELPTVGLEWSGLEPVELVTGRRYGAFDLEAYLTETRDALAIDFQYSTALFDPDTIRRWLGFYVHLLRQMTTGTAAPIPGCASSTTPSAGSSWCGGMPRRRRSRSGRSISASSRLSRDIPSAWRPGLDRNPHRWRAECPGEPAGSPPPACRRRGRAGRRRPRGALPGHGGRPAGRHEGWGRVRAVGPRASYGALGHDRGRDRARRAHRPSRARRRARGGRCRGRGPGRCRGRDRRIRRRGPRHRARPDRPRVHHQHLRIHRETQGRRDRAPVAHQPARCHAPSAWPRGR